MEWRERINRSTYRRESYPFIVGVQAVEVLSVCGDLVRWTNHRHARFSGGPRYVGCCHRRSLISLDAIENITAGEPWPISEPVAPANPPPSTLAGAGATRGGPRRLRAPWYADSAA